MAVRKGWTHECKVWAMGRFTEVTVDKPEVQGEANFLIANENLSLSLSLCCDAEHQVLFCFYLLLFLFKLECNAQLLQQKLGKVPM